TCMNDSSLILSVDDLSFRFPGIEGDTGPVVLEKLSLTVPRNGVTVLFGRADAGKTTLARIAAGLIPRFTGGALSGDVRVEGRDARLLPPSELMQSLGLVA